VDGEPRGEVRWSVCTIAGLLFQADVFFKTGQQALNTSYPRAQKLTAKFDPTPYQNYGESSRTFND
jgi:hypothetical protein